MSLNIEPFVRYVSKTTYFIENKFVIANDCRIIYIISGNGTLNCEDNEYLLQSGSLVYCPYGIPYKISSTNCMLFYIINFDFNNLNMNISPLIPQSAGDCDFKTIIKSISDDLPKIFRSVLFFKNAFWAEKFIENIYIEGLEKNYGFIESQSSNLRLLLINFYRKFIKDNASNVLCDKIKNILSNRYDLNNRSLAEILGYHPFYLNNIFKKNEGVTLHKYILHQKLIKAYELVNATNKSLDEISAICGFSSQAHFSSAFKKEFSISPGKLRLL